MSRRSVAVLGAGRVGAAIALDLAATGKWQVRACDGFDGPLAALDRAGLETRQVDLATAAGLAEALAGCEVAVGAVPGFMGFGVAKGVLEAGRHLIDISFFPEDPFPLDQVAREHGVVAAVDCGVAPGASHLLAGLASRRLERFDRYRCLVGGLPWVRRLPFEYSAPFSPIDVIEEYTRPARSVRGRQVVTVPALSDIELVDLPGVGTLEAFATDGLRSLLRDPLATDMEEKTLRWPGHAEQMKLLRSLGLFGEEPVRLAAGSVVPRELTAALLFEQWRPEPGAPELTVMRVEAEGLANGQPTRLVWDLLDSPAPSLGVSSMARTTGYTCTAVADLFAEGGLPEAGLWLPERIGATKGGWDHVARYLGERGVVIRETRD